MEINDFTTSVLKASPGTVLTLADENIPILQRTLNCTIALSKNDSILNYKEISEEEAEVFRNELSAYNQKLTEKLNNENGSLKTRTELA